MNTSSYLLFTSFTFFFEFRSLKNYSEIPKTIYLSTNCQLSKIIYIILWLTKRLKVRIYFYFIFSYKTYFEFFQNIFMMTKL